MILRHDALILIGLPGTGFQRKPCSFSHAQCRLLEYCINQLSIHRIEHRPVVKTFFLAGFIHIGHLPDWREYHAVPFVFRTDPITIFYATLLLR